MEQIQDPGFRLNLIAVNEIAQRSYACVCNDHARLGAWSRLLPDVKYFTCNYSCSPASRSGQKEVPMLITAKCTDLVL